MDFRALLRPVPRTAVLRDPEWCIWGASMVRDDDGLCHLMVSRWPRRLGHQAWVTHSEIAHAVAEQPLGPYRVTGPALPPVAPDSWDADVTHNPTVKRFGDRYYLYYMGTRGPGEYWDHRNRQRIGLAVADHPAGPWQRFEQPLIDVTPGAWDCLMTSNPSCTQGPDGRYYLLYKGVGAGEMPKGGAVLCGVAVADHPAGPFVKHPEPIIANPEHTWAVEDAFAWCQNGRFYALLKDFQGYFTGTERGTTALFESPDGFHWTAQRGEAVPLSITWEDGEVQRVHRLERMQIWFDGDRPAVLFLACLPERGDESFNVHVPLGPS
ncbi:MAG: sucrase [Armatimonadetes bacterium]|nr:sucrase [Armatimonadota bacterium]